jgi:hypothetical protein
MQTPQAIYSKVGMIAVESLLMIRVHNSPRCRGRTPGVHLSREISKEKRLLNRRIFRTTYQITKSN